MKVAKYLRSAPIDTGDRGPVMAAVVREVIVLAVWVTLLVPGDPGWMVAGSLWLHMAAAAALAWGICLYLLYRSGRLIVWATFITLLVDMTGIGALVYFTGGVRSPFVILYFYLVLNSVVLIRAWQALTVCLGNIVSFGSIVVLVHTGFIPGVSYFTGVNEADTSLIYLFTAIWLFFIFILYALVASLILRQRLNERDSDLKESLRQLTEAHEQLLDSFHNLEDMSYRLHASADILEANRQQLVNTDRLVTLGRMAASVLHEIRNPLTSILNLSELQCMGLEKIEATVPLVDNTMKIISHTQRIQRLIQNLSDAMKERNGDRFMPLDIHDILGRSLALCEQMIVETGVTVKKDLDPEKPTVLGVAGQIEQVLVNLMENACYHMQGKKRLLSIRTRIDDDWTVIEVSDTGPGIDSHNMSRIFEPFFTTKASNEGMGLGLYLARIILKEHHGKIDLESEPGKGTKVTIKLPVPVSKESKDKIPQSEESREEYPEQSPLTDFDTNTAPA